jgi:hypothetical protein
MMKDPLSEDDSFESILPSPERTTQASCPMYSESVDANFLKNYNYSKE